MDACRFIGVLVLCTLPGSAPAQEATFTLETALQRARERSVLVVAARSRIEEARARLRGAKALRDNPTVEGAVGRRSGTKDPADLDFGVSQTFELGGRRGARIAGAEAVVDREAAAADDALRRTLREVSLAFVRGLAAAQQVDLARASAGHAQELHRIAERRSAAGDVAALDVNLAASALSRIRSEVRVAEAERALALGELKVLLVLEPESRLTLAGDLGPGEAAEAALVDAVGSRPDLKALEAELREAEAEAREGRASRWPDATPSVRYEREQGTNILWGGMTLSLPLWNRGQTARGVGEARSARIRLELEALRRAVRTEVLSAIEAHRLRLAALGELQETSSRLEENETLARRSYEVGQIGLAEVLLIRRETTEARLGLLKRRLEVAESEIELLTRAGVLR